MPSSVPTSHITLDTNHSFALLDDARSEGACSRLYSNLLCTLSLDSAGTFSNFFSDSTSSDSTSFDASFAESVLKSSTGETSTAHWEAIWQQVQKALDAGYFVVSLLSYETGARLQSISERTELDQQSSLSQFLIFKQCQHRNKEEIFSWLEQQSQNQIAGIRGLEANVSTAEFTHAIDQIRAYIAAGDTYQVNYTYRLHFQSYGSALSLYLALRRRQPVPYGALIHLPNGSAILSFSPELFVRNTAGHLLARPMKGTAPASGDDVQDHETAESLRHDPKNRAENLMIVDLLRNDLGRIASVGSVKVPALFEVHRYTSVLQMTSTVEAKLRPDLDLATVMRALFPCGSITGAPKHRTMEIIRELESEDRGIYTGAIGWFDPPLSRNQLGDFCLSVPIRTLHLSAPDTLGLRNGSMGVGAGIVFDSNAEEEFAECQLKSKFLTGLEVASTFALFETMYATKYVNNDDDAGGCRHQKRHLDRLENSAHFFGFSFQRDQIERALQDYCATLNQGLAYRLRLSLQSQGQIHLQHALLSNMEAPVKLRFKYDVCTTDPLFLMHKSTHRHTYDAAWKAAEEEDCFDNLFVNQKGNITEGGRSNVFVRIGDRWYTPPVSDGVLPGVMRAILLEDPNLQAQEKSLLISELLHADEIMLCNALRGAMSARLQLD